MTTSVVPWRGADAFSLDLAKGKYRLRFDESRGEWRSGRNYVLRRCACGSWSVRSFTASTCSDCARTRQFYLAQNVAYAAVRRAVASGALLPVTRYRCVDCGEPAQHYDHRDYGRPLEVQPVCRSCNRKRGHALLPGDADRLVCAAVR